MRPMISQILLLGKGLRKLCQYKKQVDKKKNIVSDIQMDTGMAEIRNEWCSGHSAPP